MSAGARAYERASGHQGGARRWRPAWSRWRGADPRSLRRAGALLWRTLDDLAGAALPGVRTKDLADLAKARIEEAGAEAVFLSDGQPRFPGAAAITINEEVSHAPPGHRLLRRGDLVTIDSGLRLHGNADDMRLRWRFHSSPSLVNRPLPAIG